MSSLFTSKTDLKLKLDFAAAEKERRPFDSLINFVETSWRMIELPVVGTAEVNTEYSKRYTAGISLSLNGKRTHCSFPTFTTNSIKLEIKVTKNLTWKQLGVIYNLMCS